MAAAEWAVTLLPRAERQLDQLGDRERQPCLDELEDMEQGYFGDSAIACGATSLISDRTSKESR